MIEQPSDFGGLSFCRVVVVGANGAGKTWFASRLAHHMAAPVICKDALALTTGWQQRPFAQVQAQLSQAIHAPRWVLEGGPSVLSPVVLDRADAVVWLDMPAFLRAGRIIRRSIRYFGRTRPEHPQGNRDWPGWRQFRFLWRATLRGDQFAGAIAAALATTDVPVLRLRRPDEVDRMLNIA